MEFQAVAAPKKKRLQENLTFLSLTNASVLRQNDFLFLEKMLETLRK
jgi:hypothetical protein